MSIYESIIILDSLLSPKEIDTAVERFSAIITEHGGRIRKVDKWGKKRLAYEIQKKQYGFYIAIEFEGSGNIPHELEKDYNYNDKVLRYLTYRYDKHKLRAMAKAEQEARKTEAPTPAPAVEKPAETEPKVDPVPEEPTVEEPVTDTDSSEEKEE